MSISQFVITYNDYVDIKLDRGIKMRIKALREDNDLTQKTIADYLHIKQNTYSQYENGQRQVPIDVLIKLARLFGTSIDYILCETDEKKRYPKSK